MNYLEGLNPNQYEAVTSTNRVLRLIAGAGSGKTRVLTTRIAFLIDQMHVAPWKILGITFTNKAANEMNERVGKILGSDHNGVWLSTIHSLCVRILRQEAASIGYPRNFTIADTDDQKSILKEAYRQYDIDSKVLNYNTVLNYIANNKYAGISPSMALANASTMLNERNKAICYDFYQLRLKQIYAFDFDDLIIETIHLFDKFPMIQAKWQDKFNHIMVDEFQDVDRYEYDLVKRLTGRTNHLCVVGDPDQTIYTWRGADVDIILHFDKDYPDCKTIFLNENYRSTPIILKGANSVIEHNRNRIKKELFTNNKSDAKIIHCSCANEEAESRYVLDNVEKLHKNGLNYHDMAILYRSNYISRQFEKELLDRGIPYVIYGGMKFYERAEIKNAIAYLRMVTTHDDLAFKRIINLPRRGIGDKTLDALLECAQEHDTTMFDAISLNPDVSGKAASALIRFENIVRGWVEYSNDHTMIELLDHILDESGYRASLENERETDRLENLKELMNDMQSYMLRYPESSLDEYLQMVSLYGDKDDEKNEDTLRMMTVHSAKGLEFDTVFVVGMSDGVFPNERAMNEGHRGEEEERRLAYVAFTRAKKRLFITDSQGFSYQLQSARMPSRFIREISADVIEHTGLSEQANNRTIMRNTPSRMYESHILDRADDDIPVLTSGKAVKYRPGQKVSHDTYGDGIIVKVEGPFVSVAFPLPHGLKRLGAAASQLHPKMKS